MLTTTIKAAGRGVLPPRMVLQNSIMTNYVGLSGLTNQYYYELRGSEDAPSLKRNPDNHGWWPRYLDPPLSRGGGNQFLMCFSRYLTMGAVVRAPWPGFVQF